MKRISRRLLIRCLAAGMASSAYAEQSPRLQALIITGQHMYHDWRATTAALRQMMEASGRFEVRATEDFRGAGAATLASYDLVVLNYFDSGKPEHRWGERAETALLDFVRGGKGVVVYHYALGAFDGWTEYEKMCGANWRPGNGQHSPRHDFEVRIEDDTHLITQGIKSFYQRDDELYANLRWRPEAAHHTLATAWDEHFRYPEEVRKKLSGPGKRHPVMWTLRYGKGRVFVTALGHHVPAMGDGFRTTFLRGSEWAATERVTLPAFAGSETQTGHK